jgi:multidrug transporter EmrE-like cation transporter
MSLPQIFALSAVEVIGDVGFKEYANKGGIVNLLQGVIGYIGVMICLVISLQGSTLLLVNGAWDGISCLIESIYVYIFLGERFDDTSQYIGLVFVIIGILLLKIPMNKKVNK